MNTPTELIRREINKTKLPKRALSILEKCDPLITHYDQARSGIKRIPLYEKDFLFLAEKLKDDGQDIANRTYRGYRLAKYAE
jgi:hypothetical protein